ncbi:hypothetical protein Zmor_012402 [Zophobas morio]|uniref:Pre-C2HC domain-containing protein n=1 Tax=Zophobas morio TaxID=2755281 RepID=A0AA38HFM0_9CUCU|nr:hypothetical protein Zmor_012402 [Zophobas morio]
MGKQESQHFTYQLPEDKPHKFVMCGIYCELDISLVEANLGAQGITQRVPRMHTENTVNSERRKSPLPLVLVHIPRTKRQKLLEMKTISHLRIKIEELR